LKESYYKMTRSLNLDEKVSEMIEGIVNENIKRNCKISEKESDIKR
jgi:hypothetical protein